MPYTSSAHASYLPQSRFDVSGPDNNSSQSGIDLRKIGKRIGVVGAIGTCIFVLTALPPMAVNLACNNNAPEGAIARIRPVGGTAGPFNVNSMCPDAFILEGEKDDSSNRKIVEFAYPSRTNFNNRATALKNGIISMRDTGIQGALLEDAENPATEDARFFDDALIKGLRTSIGADNTDPANLNISSLASNQDHQRVVDKSGKVHEAALTSGYYHQRLGSVELLGKYAGKKLEDLPDTDRIAIKAAAAVYSGVDDGREIVKGAV